MKFRRIMVLSAVLALAGACSSAAPTEPRVDIAGAPHFDEGTGAVTEEGGETAGMQGGMEGTDGGTGTDREGSMLGSGN